MKHKNNYFIHGLIQNLNNYYNYKIKLFIKKIIYPFHYSVMSKNNYKSLPDINQNKIFNSTWIRYSNEYININKTY